MKLVNVMHISHSTANIQLGLSRNKIVGCEHMKFGHLEFLSLNVTERRFVRYCGLWTATRPGDVTHTASSAAVEKISIV